MIRNFFIPYNSNALSDYRNTLSFHDLEWLLVTLSLSVPGVTTISLSRSMFWSDYRFSLAFNIPEWLPFRKVMKLRRVKRLSLQYIEQESEAVVTLEH